MAGSRDTVDRRSMLSRVAIRLRVAMADIRPSRGIRSKGMVVGMVGRRRVRMVVGISRRRRKRGGALGRLVVRLWDLVVGCWEGRCWRMRLMGTGGMVGGMVGVGMMGVAGINDAESMVGV